MIQERIQLDSANTNKQLRFYQQDGKFIRLSVDEAIANNMHHWKGWKCSAGVRGLYIDFDGNIWRCNTASGNFNRFNFSGQTKFIADKMKLVSELEKDTPQKVKNKEWEFEMEYRKYDRAYKKVFPIAVEGQSNNPVGHIGNIYEGAIFPTEDFTCPWNACGCGADVFIAKAKTEEAKTLLAVTNEGYYGQEKTNSNLVNILTEKPVAMELNFMMPYQILWDLGRRCNYDCSYCWPGVHNRDAEHKSLDSLIDAASRIIDEWANGQQIRWNFGGGEPTLNPDFLNFLKFLKSENQWVLVTTNGSRPAKYWREAMNYLNSVNLSVHFEFADDRKIFQNVEVICEHMDTNADDYWLEVKLMTPPQFFDRSLTLREEILKNTSITLPGKNGRVKGAVSMVPIRGKGSNSGNLIDGYSEQQLKILQNQG